MDKIVRLFVILCLVISSRTLELKKKKFLVIGGGPIGWNLTYKLLEAYKDAFVDIYDDSGLFENDPSIINPRSQVIVMASSVVGRFPSSLKKRLFTQEYLNYIDAAQEVGKTVNDPDFWPIPADKFKPSIHLTHFQESIYEEIKDHFETRNEKQRFTLILETFTPEKFKEKSLDYDMVFVAGGSVGGTKLAKDILGESDFVSDEESRLGEERYGIVVTYNAPSPEKVQKNFVVDGVYYAHSNDPAGHVQLYTTYLKNMGGIGQDKFELKAKFPESLEKKMRFSRYTTPLKLDGSGGAPGTEINDAERKWLKLYYETLLEILGNRAIVPAASECNIFLAPRSQYYFKHVANLIKTDNIDTTFVKIGDAAGGTDYKLALSCNRGLKFTDFLLQALKEKNTVQEFMDALNEYWAAVVSYEFNRQQWREVWNDPALVWKYYIKGRPLKMDTVEVKWDDPAQVKIVMDKFLKDAAVARSAFEKDNPLLLLPKEKQSKADPKYYVVSI